MALPNILVIVTDQQRADTIGALGNPLIRTPAIDSLVVQGTTFTRAYTPAPICSPARVSMMTGLPPHVHRFTDHDWWHWEPPDGPPSRAPHDPPFTKAAYDAGYQTFMAGKLHHHGRFWLTDGVEAYAGREPVIHPMTRQLPSYHDFLEGKGYSPCLPPSMGMGSEYYMVPQATSAPAEHSRPEWLADQCIDFLQRRDSARPFLMHCHFECPHPPVCNPMPWALLYRAHEMDGPYRPANYREYQCRTNRYQNRYKCRDTGQEDDTGYRIWKAAYYGSISLVDHAIGRILDALGPERENTLIVFTSDHGELAGDFGCVGKRCMLEPAIRIPLIVSWPGHVPGGAQCDTPVSLMDLFPTVLDAIGSDAPTRSDETQSWIRTANSGGNEQRLVFSQFSSGWCGQYAVSDGRWKYAYSAPDGREWLFELGDSLRDGPNRINDSAAAPHLARLKAALLARHDSAVDPWSNAVDAGNWRKHTPPPEDYLDDPTSGYLWQERGADQLQTAVDALGPGYARQAIKTETTSTLHALHAVCGGRSPFEKEETEP